MEKNKAFLSKVKAFLSKDLTSADVKIKGQRNYKTGKILMFSGICGFALLLLISLIVIVAYSPDVLFDYVLLLDTRAGLEFVNFIVNLLVFASYCGVLSGIIGVPIYFYGINLYALGRIAHNTEKK